MNTPTDKEIRDWYMGYGVEHRAELAEVEGEAFDRYLVERDAKVAKATEERIIKLLEEYLSAFQAPQEQLMQRRMADFIELIKGEKE